ncbi:hypothetical protein HBB16_18315 [Pseudonocardia sp. MCCB 268]|nr:hypothetical protein [Pseudonocardia cytotoxica]
MLPAGPPPGQPGRPARRCWRTSCSLRRGARRLVSGCTWETGRLLVTGKVFRVARHVASSDLRSSPTPGTRSGRPWFGMDDLPFTHESGGGDAGVVQGAGARCAP